MLLARLRETLAPYGIDRLGVASSAAWDARAPASLSTAELFPTARSVIVVGNAGRALWSALREAVASAESLACAEHPLDSFVERALDAADRVLAAEGVGARRFDPTYRSFLAGGPQIDFRTLAELAGLGAPGPFGLSIDREHGPWWALRGAWLVDLELEPSPPAARPCDGCSAPCLGAQPEVRSSSLERSTAAMRDRCVLGRDARYEDEAIAYHHDRVRPRWLVR